MLDLRNANEYQRGRAEALDDVERILAKYLGPINRAFLEVKELRNGATEVPKKEE